MVDHALGVVGSRDGDGFLCELVQGGWVQDVPPVLGFGVRKGFGG